MENICFVQQALRAKAFDRCLSFSIWASILRNLHLVNLHKGTTGSKQLVKESCLVTVSHKTFIILRGHGNLKQSQKLNFMGLLFSLRG